MLHARVDARGNRHKAQIRVLQSEPEISDQNGICSRDSLMLNDERSASAVVEGGKSGDPKMMTDSVASRSAMPFSGLPPETQSIAGTDVAKQAPPTVVYDRAPPPRDRNEMPLVSRIERVMDVALAFGLLVFVLPLMGLIALSLKCEGRGSILLWHPRVGYDGRVVYALRFRTKIPSETKGASFRSTQRTRIGEVLWRTHLDGLPMLLNVLRGDMTIVGIGRRARLLW